MTSNIMLTLAFLAGVLAVYYLTPRAGRQWILLAASLLFYLSADPRLLLLAAGSALWSFAAGIGTERAGTKKEKRIWLAAAVLHYCEVAGYTISEVDAVMLALYRASTDASKECQRNTKFTLVDDKR